LKSFYVFYVQKHMQKDFPNTVSYNPVLFYHNDQERWIIMAY
jgi:hypothetical protein